MKTKLTLLVTAVALCLQQSLTGADLKKGLLEYLPFDVSGSVDSGVLPKSAKAHGAPSMVMQFDGEKDYLDLGPMKFGDQLTISVWASIDEDKQKYSIIMSKYDGDAGNGDISVRRSFQIGVDLEQTLSWVVSNNGRDHETLVSPKKAYKIGELTHLVCIYGNGKMSISVNGRSGAQKAVKTGVVYNAPVPVAVGASDITYGSKGEMPLHNFKGLMDNIRIYNRALSAEEVKALYDLENPKAE